MYQHRFRARPVKGLRCAPVLRMTSGHPWTGHAYTDPVLHAAGAGKGWLGSKRWHRHRDLLTPVVLTTRTVIVRVRTASETS